MLEIKNLSHTYANGTVALDDVSLSIPRGMYGLLGPNGAGKSTLMRTVATLQQPTAGSIQFGDIDVLADPERLRKTLGDLPQDFGVYPRVSAYAMLDQLAVLKGITGAKDRRAVVETLLAQTNLWAVRNKSIAGFSGGMRQRFGIAQALIGNPELIIVDEPTAGLDPAERNRFLNLLSSIGRDVTVILSTHIVDDVRELCPRMAIIASGEVLLEGAPAESIASLDGQIWSRVLSSDDELRAIEAELKVVSSHLVGGQHEIRVFAPSSPGAGFRGVSSGLEDVYFLNVSRQALN
jgi:ABC-type multidrug transport system ATPase subunit